MRPQRSPFAFIAPHLRFNDDPPPAHPYLPSFQTRHLALAALVPDGWRLPQRPSESGSANHVDSRDQWAKDAGHGASNQPHFVVASGCGPSVTLEVRSMLVIPKSVNARPRGR